MTERAKRRAEKRRRQANRERTTQNGTPTLELPRPFRLLAEALDDVGSYAALADDAAEAEARAVLQIRQAVAKVVDAAAPYDPLDVLEVIRTGNMLANPETFEETTHEGSAAVVDMGEQPLTVSAHACPLARLVLPDATTVVRRFRLTC